jgi:hypothetical protein
LSRRSRRPSLRTRELPRPLPPGERTIGQLVAETIRLYGARFWYALPLGIPFAVIDELAIGRSAAERSVVLAVAAPFLAAAYAGACAIVAPTRPSRRALALGVLTGTLVFLPAAALFTWFALLAVAYLGLVGLVVPAAVLEGRGPLDSFRRAGELGRADYVHALGSLATLVIVVFLSRLVLVALLQGQADNTVRVAVVLADLALAPLLFLGAALLYFDQAARVRSRRPDRRSRDADLHPPHDADAAGRADPQVEP